MNSWQQAKPTIEDLTPNQLIERYKKAYKKLNAKECTITYVKGWFRHFGTSNFLNSYDSFRRSKFEDMVRTLEKRIIDKEDD